MSRHEDRTVATTQRWLLLKLPAKPAYARRENGAPAAGHRIWAEEDPLHGLVRWSRTIQRRDRAFGVEDRVALWTKADSITRFGYLDIRLLGEEPRTQEGEEP